MRHKGRPEVASPNPFGVPSNHACCTLRRTLALGGLLGALVSSIQGQVADPTFPVNGTHDKGLVATLLEHATIHVDAGTTMENATLVMHNGRIVAVGPDGETSHAGPAVRVDMTGLHLYPSFVDLNSDFGTPRSRMRVGHAPPKTSATRKGPMDGTKRFGLKRPQLPRLTQMPKRRSG